MRVNSVSTSLFALRLVANSCMVIAMFFCSSEVSFAGATRVRSLKAETLLVPPKTATPLPHTGLDRDLRAKQANLFVRLIGHRLLMQSGDFTSRVLPVTETREGIFLMQFEKEIVFSHDSLMVLAHSLLPKAQFPSGYIVTVHDCITGSIVYGFEINNISDNLACRGRSQPAGCYTIEVAFPDLYKDVKEEHAALTPKPKATKSVKSGPNIELPNPVEAKAEAFNVGPQETTRQLAELKSFTPTGQIEDPKQFNTTSFDSPLINLVYTSMLISLGVTLVIARFGKILKPTSAKAEHSTEEKESVAEMPALGKFLFDAKDHRLLLGSEEITLTEKECRILELLHQDFGELVPRETLMQKIWISEGVITGRSLDMFVSKLRKKLSGDPELRITNVHGKGYKLEVVAQEA